MHFKLIVALVEYDWTNAILEAARHTGATGSKLINQAWGEGVQEAETFLA